MRFFIANSFVPARGDLLGSSVENHNIDIVIGLSDARNSGGARGSYSNYILIIIMNIVQILVGEISLARRGPGAASEASSQAHLVTAGSDRAGRRAAGIAGALSLRIAGPTRRRYRERARGAVHGSDGCEGSLQSAARGR